MIQHKSKIRSPLAKFLRMILISSALINSAYAKDIENGANHFSLDSSSLYASASATRTPDGTDVSVLESERTYSFDPDGNSTYTQYMVYKVLSPAGVESWNDLSMNWSPWRNQRPTLKARVIASDGKVYMLDQATIADSPAYETDSAMYSDERTLRAPLPAISVGSVVETEIILKDTFPFPKSGNLERSFFQMSQPVQHFRLTLQAPKSLNLRYKLDLLPNIKPQHSEQNNFDTWVFESGPTPGYEDVESGVPNDVSAYPVVTFALGTSWQELAQSYSKIVNLQVTTAKLDGLVDRLIKGKTTSAEKISALVEYLNKEIRYTGIEFNQASIVPHSPAETLNRKFGDCKDKSTLLVAMLRSAGIPANIALLNVTNQLDLSPDLPGMGLFDHAIVYVPGEPGIWIDATDTNARVGQLPDDDHDRMALIIDANTTSLTKVVGAKSEDNAVFEEREIYLSDNGPARVVETSKPKGNYEADFRSAYADLTNKKTKENLTDYVKNQYLAEKLDRSERTDPKDFQQPFTLVLESKRAMRGYTDLNEANTYIEIDNLFNGLPNELKTRELTDEEIAKATRTHKKREFDYQLTRPFTTEWHYKIVPPAGFEPATLPPNINISAGPTNFLEEFSSDPDGTVHVTLKFDSVKCRYTTAEQLAMRTKIAELIDSPLIKIKFNLHAQVLFTQGKAKESFDAYRELIAQHPKNAINHLRRADALRKAGMGDAARAEALLAVKLDPKSSFAYAILAEVLQYDSIGRWHHAGADLKGAAAAYKMAISLDPNAKYLVGRYAILLEYDDNGIRYSDKADLNAAVTAYKTLTTKELVDMELPNNLAYALFYANKFAEAKANAEASSTPQQNLIVASEAQLNGVTSALAEARRRSANDANYKEIVSSAGKMLMSLREYSKAAQMLEEGTSGAYTAATMGLIATLKKTSKVEDVHFENHPDDFIKSLLVASMRSDFSIEKLQAVQSLNAQLISKDLTDEERENELQAPRKIRATSIRSGIPTNVLIDTGLQTIQLRSVGDDTIGYRETVQIPGQSNQFFFVVKENGKYKLLGMSSKPAAIALEAIDRVNRNELSGAQALLNWLRDAIPMDNGDDKFGGNPFPRFWSQAQANSDARQITLAAASLLVQERRTAERGIALLEKAKTSGIAGAEDENINLSLMIGYLELKNYKKVLITADELLQSAPLSKRIFFAQLEALRGEKRFDEANSLVRERLAKLPENIEALRALSLNSLIQGNYMTAYEQAMNVLLNGSSEPGDFNQAAWLSLFFNRVNGPDVDTALRASELRPNSPPILHTLGTVYAEIGKEKEAYGLMLQVMVAWDKDQPSPDVWYVLGRIAEQYGERDIALADYAKVPEPKDVSTKAMASYVLAKNRVAFLRKE